MKKAKLIGTIYGITGAAAYGVNPLFAKFLYFGGIGVNSILFYRYSIAILILFLWLKIFKRISLKINLKEGIVLFLLGIIFSMSSITLFKSYQYIDVGIASTLLFIYPVIVAIIMSLLFKEKIKKVTVISIVLTLLGVLLLCNGKSGVALDLTGVFLVLLSAFCWATYMVCVKKIPILTKMNNDKLTFYVIFFGLFIYIYNLKFCTQLQMLNTPVLWLCSVGLAIIPTIISIETVNLSIKLIGSTKTAILGALEPVTAIIIGVSLFGENLTLRIICGIISIIGAVVLVVLNQNKK